MRLGFWAISLVALFVWAVSWRAARSREIAVLVVRGGRTQLLRGQLPGSLLDALRDVFARAAVQNATVKVVRGDGRPRISARGLNEPTLQRARNVLGTFPAHKLMPQR